MSSKVRIRLFACLILLMIAAPCSAQTRDTGTFSEIYYSEALDRASNSGKDVYVLYTSDACPPCRFLEKHILVQDTVSRILRSNFVSIRLYTSDPSFDSLRATWNLAGLPTHVFVQSNGELKHAFVGGAPPRASDSVLASYIRKYAHAKSDSLSFVPLLSRYHDGLLAIPEMRQLAYLTKDQAPTYPEALYSVFPVIPSEITERYFDLLGNPEFFTKDRAVDLRELVFRINSPSILRALANVGRWRQEIGDSAVVSVLFDVLRNDLATRYNDPEIQDADAAKFVENMAAAAPGFSIAFQLRVSRRTFDLAVDSDLPKTACVALSWHRSLHSDKSESVAEMERIAMRVFGLAADETPCTSH